MIKAIARYYGGVRSVIDWKLLLFLILVLNVKLIIKLGVVFLFIVLNKKIITNRNSWQQRFIWFYLAMLLIATTHFIVDFTTHNNEWLAFAWGASTWLLCLGAACIVSWFVQNTDTRVLHQTVIAFFKLNMLVTILQLVAIMLDSGSINPYTYQGMHQLYFISTGDRMTGISFDVSTTNAMISAMSVIYFLNYHRLIWSIISMVILLLTASNFIILLLIVLLLGLFIFRSTRVQKSTIVVLVLLTVLFFSRVSPQNHHYIREALTELLNGRKKTSTTTSSLSLIQTPDSLLDHEQRRKKIALLYVDSIHAVQWKNRFKWSKSDTNATRSEWKPALIKPGIPVSNIHAPNFQRLRDTSAIQRRLLSFSESNYKGTPLFPLKKNVTQYNGKLLAFSQTWSFLQSNPSYWLTGVGMGRFSSKLAFRTTALHVAGGYPASFAYIHPYFLYHHLVLYIDYFSKDDAFHSFINSPDSVYDQLVAEYGLLGLSSFLVLYVGFFWRIRKGYAIPLLLLLLGSFWVGYWFEQLSIVILFELLLLLNKKEYTTTAHE